MTHGLVSLGILLTVTACVGAGGSGAPVRPGIEVLLEDSMHLLAGRRVGILTNQTGVDRSGRSDVQRLFAAGAQVTAIFSPEHGYRGVLDQEHIDHGVDRATALPIYSLYGTVRAPTAAMLESVDVMVIDLQDIGARPYTHISTALRTMEAARERGIAVVVLDRPNPIGGVLVQGPVLDTAFTSFNGMLPVALRHGMTLGELALMGNTWLGLDVDLTVVPAQGWRRDRWFDETGLLWIRPSPSMPNLESATHYPGLVLFEATNLSVGRGTRIAFQLIGAPWLDAAAVMRRVGDLPGAELMDTVVTPRDPPDGKYDGLAIRAVRIRTADRGRYDPARAAVHLLAAVLAVHGDSLSVNTQRFDHLAGTDALWRALSRGETPAQVVRGWEDELRRFRRERARYLLYE